MKSLPLISLRLKAIALVEPTGQPGMKVAAKELPPGSPLSLSPPENIPLKYVAEARATHVGLKKNKNKIFSKKTCFPKIPAFQKYLLSVISVYDFSVTHNES
jgi:hypothetical protein